MQITSQDLPLPNFAIQNRNTKMTYVNKASVIAVGVCFIILSIAVVSARFYVRRSKAGYGLDDWLCVPALVGLLFAFIHQVQAEALQVLVITECCIMIVGKPKAFCLSILGHC